MENHFHLLLVPEKEGVLGKRLHGVTFRYTEYFNGKYERALKDWLSKDERARYRRFIEDGGNQESHIHWQTIERDKFYR